MMVKDKLEQGGGKEGKAGHKAKPPSLFKIYVSF